MSSPVDPPPLAGPPPSDGPWLVVQILEPVPADGRRYVQALCEALAAQEIRVTDMHPAVEDPSTVLACCPDAPLHSAPRWAAVADLLTRRLEFESALAVRVSAYPTLEAAHAAIGD